MYYEMHGQGEPLVLIAGLMSDSQSWLPIIQDLAEFYRVIIFDNRGVGRTVSPIGYFSVDNLADDTENLLLRLGIEKAAVLGHSLGGYIAQQMAAAYPERIDKLILVSTTVATSDRNRHLLQHWWKMQKQGFPKGLWFENVFYWLFTQQFFMDRTRLEESVRLAVDYPYPQSISDFKRQLDAVNTFDFRGKIKKITASTLVVAGEQDILIPADESKLLSRLIGKAKFEIIKNSAHSIHLENPWEFINIVKDFLSGADHK